MESLGAIMSDDRLVYLKHLTIDLKFRVDMPIVQSMDTARQQCAPLSRCIQRLLDVLSNPVLEEKSISIELRINNLLGDWCGRHFSENRDPVHNYCGEDGGEMIDYEAFFGQLPELRSVTEFRYVNQIATLFQYPGLPFLLAGRMPLVEILRVTQTVCCINGNEGARARKGVSCPDKWHTVLLSC